MKYSIFSILILFSIPLFAQQDQDHWESYLARYEKGAGSTLVNMSLKGKAPIAQYAFLLKVGVKVNHCSSDGLPEDNEWDRLFAISEKVKAIVGAHDFRDPGTFTYQCWRTDYYYIKDTNALRQTLTEALKKYLPDHEYKVEIKQDPKWEAYLEFLYPNEETMEFITNQKVIIPLTKAGDKLTKPRLVDHWLYFKTDADRSKFISYALQEHYKVEGKEYSQKSDLHYQLHLSRVDKVELAYISALTLQLRRKAKEFNGDYDGWETFVIKE